METATVARTDRTTVRFNAASTSGLLLLGFVTDLPWLVAFVGAVMIVGSLWPRAGLFKQVYWRVVKPRGWLRPGYATGRVETWLDVEDDPAAHQFAQALGAIVLVLSSASFLAGISVLGWALAWVVIVLAALNVLNICVGCFIYYQLNRRGIHISMPT